MTLGFVTARWTTPEIFSDDIYRRLEAGGDCGSGVGPGWIPLIERLNIDLQAIDPDYTIAQIKEKFGGLRFYAQSNVSEANWTRWMNLIQEAEDTSYTTCEVCGGKGKKDGRTGWIKTLCWYHGWERIIRRKYENFKYDLFRTLQKALGLDHRWKRRTPKYKRDR
jgi:hypothetical protein